MDLAPRLERTALVVDHDVFMASALAELLEEGGFDVHTASNGFSALRRAIELRPTLILLDLALPERSGVELLEDLRAEPSTRDAAIVVVSGQLERLPESHLSATDGVVAKPFEVNELLATIQHALQHAISRRLEVPRVAGPSHHEATPRLRHTAPRGSRGRHP
jgi:CheY-like chemotaxis protein